MSSLESGSEGDRTKQKRSWELAQDHYGVFVYVNGVIASYRPGSQKTGQFGCVCGAHVEDTVGRTIKVSL